jgi:hypothetical protein
MSISHSYDYLFSSLHFFHLLRQAGWLRLFPSDTANMPGYDFGYSRIFMELFVFLLDSPEYPQPGVLPPFLTVSFLLSLPQCSPSIPTSTPSLFSFYPSLYNSLRSSNNVEGSVHDEMIALSEGSQKRLTIFNCKHLCNQM